MFCYSFLMEIHIKKSPRWGSFPDCIGCVDGCIFISGKFLAVSIYGYFKPYSMYHFATLSARGKLYLWLQQAVKRVLLRHDYLRKSTPEARISACVC